MSKNILAIGAHFDDIELGCGVSIAKHSIEGDKFTLTLQLFQDFQIHTQNLLEKFDCEKRGRQQ